MRRYSGQAAGVRAKRQWLCNKCLHTFNDAVKQCPLCGGHGIEYFQSKRELTRWRELLLLQGAGHITKLRRQIKFEFAGEDGRALHTPGGNTMTHVVDFSFYRDGQLIYEDSKGVDTELGYLKRELVRYFHDVTIRLT